MKTFLLFSALLSCFSTFHIQAKELQALFSHASFYSHTEGPYVETYLMVYGPSVNYVKTPEGAWQASLKVTLVFKQDDRIVDFRKYNLLSAGLEDTLRILPNFIDQQRISLPGGDYQLEVTLADNNGGEDPVGYTYPVDLEYDHSNHKFSDIQLVESFQPTEGDNILTKSGFDLVPYVSDFYPPQVGGLNFYTELYNLDKKIGEGQDFLFLYYFESVPNAVVMDNFVRRMRQKSAPVNPLLVSIPIADLPNGQYNLVVEAVDRNNEILASQRIPFGRSNPGLQLNVVDIKAVDITSTFAEKITSPDSLRFYLLSLVPIATMTQRQFINQLTEMDDFLQMRKFLFSFWETRNDQYPEAEWNFYKAQVLAIEDYYKTKIKHGFETDMGYTWLRYGTPDQVEDSKHEPNAVPYIIWHYFHIENQSNVRFVFTNPHLVGTEYSLIYSDARDDRYNTDSEQFLYNRSSSFGSSGGYGSRFLSNFRR
jgi:GWxTD domain-containing protein